MNQDTKTLIVSIILVVALLVVFHLARNLEVVSDGVVVNTTPKILQHEFKSQVYTKDAMRCEYQVSFIAEDRHEQISRNIKYLIATESSKLLVQDISSETVLSWSDQIAHPILLGWPTNCMNDY